MSDLLLHDLAPGDQVLIANEKANGIAMLIAAEGGVRMGHGTCEDNQGMYPSLSAVRRARRDVRQVEHSCVEDLR